MDHPDPWRDLRAGTGFQPTQGRGEDAPQGAVRQRQTRPRQQRLEQRVRLFLVDNERGQSMSIYLGGDVYQVGVSEPDGHFQAELHIAADTIEQRRAPQQHAAGFLRFTAVMQPADQRSFPGRVQFVPPQGLSVISDIDDTIKHSQVTDRRGTPGQHVPARVSACARHAGTLSRVGAAGAVVFHYVSGSPWQLYLPLAEFFSAQHFPPGSVDLKYFRLKDPSALSLLQSQEDTKMRAIEPILQAFPQRRFILIGDSGEQDPEIYTLLRGARQQIVAILHPQRHAGTSG